ncbi:hypothetical protein [Modestobacter sp. NPDC049651]
MTSSWRRRRQAARNRRALISAIDGANTPAMRHELMGLSGSSSQFLNALR